jgi:hypothetical protein
MFSVSSSHDSSATCALVINCVYAFVGILSKLRFNGIFIIEIYTRKMRWTGHVARMREKRNAYGILVGMPEGKRPLRRPSRRWVDNIKMDLREIGRDGMGWIDLAQNREQWRALANTVMNLRVP